MIIIQLNWILKISTMEHLKFRCQSDMIWYGYVFTSITLGYKPITIEIPSSNADHDTAKMFIFHHPTSLVQRNSKPYSNKSWPLLNTFLPCLYQSWYYKMYRSMSANFSFERCKSISTIFSAPSALLCHQGSSEYLNLPFQSFKRWNTNKQCV